VDQVTLQIIGSSWDRSRAELEASSRPHEAPKNTNLPEIFPFDVDGCGAAAPHDHWISGRLQPESTGSNGFEQIEIKIAAHGKENRTALQKRIRNDVHSASHFKDIIGRALDTSPVGSAKYQSSGKQ
jgi:hypothetical protein